MVARDLEFGMAFGLEPAQTPFRTNALYRAVTHRSHCRTMPPSDIRYGIVRFLSRALKNDAKQGSILLFVVGGAVSGAVLARAGLADEFDA